MSQTVFLAGPFKQHVVQSCLANHHIQHIQALMATLQACHMHVDNAHKRENWGQDMMTPAACTQADYQAIVACDVLVADPGIPASPGTHIELGWAAALGKPIVLLLDHALEDYAYLVQGLSEVTAVTVLHYTTTAECCEQLEHLFRDGREGNDAL